MRERVLLFCLLGLVLTEGAAAPPAIVPRARSARHRATPLLLIQARLDTWHFESPKSDLALLLQRGSRHKEAAEC
jgi:hypothetical protein